MGFKDSLAAKIAFCFVIAALVCFCCKQAFSFEFITQSRYELAMKGCQRYKKEFQRSICKKRMGSEINYHKTVVSK